MIYVGSIEHSSRIVLHLPCNLRSQASPHSICRHCRSLHDPASETALNLHPFSPRGSTFFCTRSLCTSAKTVAGKFTLRNREISAQHHGCCCLCLGGRDCLSPGTFPYPGVFNVGTPTTRIKHTCTRLQFCCKLWSKATNYAQNDARLLNIVIPIASRHQNGEFKLVPGDQLLAKTP